MTPLDPEVYLDLVRRALAEDVGPGDRTTAAIVPADLHARATLRTRERCVAAGLQVVAAVFAALDPAVRTSTAVADGDRCDPEQVLAIVDGPARAILTGERTALNFLQRLCGIATLTRRFVDASEGRITILDTRKTTPGLRALEKYAVRCGGGSNHRFGLYDAVLIKDNHIRIAGGIANAVARVRQHRSSFNASVPIEVEAQILAEVDEALAAGADTIMLDNMSVADMREAIRRIAGRARVEISGGVTLAGLPERLAIGADVVSIGALTHSAPAVDISLELETGASPSPR